MRLSILQLVLMHEGRATFDYLIDRKSLAQILDITKFGLVGRLERDRPSENAATVRVLTAVAPADLDPNRVILFGCSECGDIGCGAVTVAVTRDDDTFTWADFAHENNYDESMTVRFPGVGPFTFDADAYRSVLAATAAEEPNAAADRGGG